MGSQRAGQDRATFTPGLEGGTCKEIKQNPPGDEGRHHQHRGQVRALLSRQDTGAAQEEGSLWQRRGRQAQRYFFPGNSVSIYRMGGGSSQQLFIQSKGDYGFPLSLAMENALSGQIRTVAPEIPY